MHVCEFSGLTKAEALGGRKVHRITSDNVKLSYLIICTDFAPVCKMLSSRSAMRLIRYFRRLDIL